MTKFQKSKPIDWENNSLNTGEIPRDKISFGRIDIFEDRLGRRLKLPVIAARGKEGPVLGITAAVHGNEINGIPTIHALFDNIDIENLVGTIVAIPIVNLPGYLAYQREFTDGIDLNRVMPGEENGPPSSVYNYYFTNRVLKHFNLHLDLHTASFGRTNSHYIRANLQKDDTRRMAMIQHADIILHADGPQNSVRDVANQMGISSITIELGNPQIFQPEIVNQAGKGILNIMKDQGMLPGNIVEPENSPKICSSSYWTRCSDGGILKVHKDLKEEVSEGELVATLFDIYGREEIQYHAPESGVVIGRNVNPVVSTADRIIHLGILER